MPNLHLNWIGSIVQDQSSIVLTLHLFAVDAFGFEDKLVWTHLPAPRTTSCIYSVITIERKSILIGYLLLVSTADWLDQKAW